MEIEMENQKILEEIVSNPSVKGKTLEKVLGISRRQLGYRIQKINMWLEQEGYPQIERTSQGQFIVQSELLDLFQIADGQDGTLSDQQYFSIPARRYLLMLMLYSEDNAYSLTHFSIDLKVSKNTIIHDIQYVKSVLEESNLRLKYTRNLGYQLLGDEVEIRRFFFKLIEKRHTYDITDTDVLRALNLTFEEIQLQERELKEVETFLRSRFIDQSFTSLPFLLCIIKRRIKAGHIVRPLNISYQDLHGTKEYEASEILIQSFDHIPTEEKLYLTLHLLSTSVQWVDLNVSEKLPELKRAVYTFIYNFEKLTCIEIENKQKLFQQLILHLKPAFYRIRYELNDVDDLNDPLKGMYQELFHLVKQSSKPIAEFFDILLPDNEIAYLTMLVGGSLRNQEVNFEGKVKAIIVCPQGTSVSQMMLLELRNLFPELIFLDALSIRDLENYELDYDLIFAPVFVLTHKKLFITKVFLSSNEQRKLRREVLRYLNQDTSQVSEEIERLIEIIRKSSTVNDIQNLRNDLENYVDRFHALSGGEQHTYATKQELTLYDLIPARHIQKAYYVADMEEAIEKAAEPLIKNHSVHQNYVEEMKATFDDSYMIIMQNIAIPHAYSDKYVNKTAMSMLILQKPVRTKRGHDIHIIVPIAATDKVSHLKALLQLRDLAQNTQAIRSIIQSRKISEISQWIARFSEKEDQ